MENKMKKSELKTGMILQFGEDNFATVFLNSTRGDIISNCGIGDSQYCFLDDFSSDNLENWERNPGKLTAVYTPSKNEHFVNTNFKHKWELLWKRKEEKPICEIDGVEYSESTLRSIIKKAHE